MQKFEVLKEIRMPLFDAVFIILDAGLVITQRTTLGGNIRPDPEARGVPTLETGAVVVCSSATEPLSSKS